MQEGWKLLDMFCLGFYNKAQNIITHDDIESWLKVKMNAIKIADKSMQSKEKEIDLLWMLIVCNKIKQNTLFDHGFGSNMIHWVWEVSFNLEKFLG